MYRTKFRFIGQSAFRGEFFLEIDQSEKKFPVAAMFFGESGRNEHPL